MPWAMVAFYRKLCADFPHRVIEDGMPRTIGMAGLMLTKELGGGLQLVGDGPISSPTWSASRPASQGASNSVLIKVNQIGSLTETLDAVELPSVPAGHGHLPPLGRKPKTAFIAVCRGHWLGPDQDRVAGALERVCKVQPAAAHRGGIGRRGDIIRELRLSRPGRNPAAATRVSSFVQIAAFAENTERRGEARSPEEEAGRSDDLLEHHCFFSVTTRFAVSRKRADSTSFRFLCALSSPLCVLSGGAPARCITSHPLAAAVRLPCGLPAHLCVSQGGG